MPSKIDRFTQPARRVLQLANDAAERYKHNYIGTEHILIGLIQEEGGIGGQVLRSDGATPDRVVEMVERMTESKSRVGGGKLDLTPRTKQVLEYAVGEARALNHDYVGTEHLLLGLIRQDDGVAIDVLRQLGLTQDRIRCDVIQILSVEEERKTQWRGGEIRTTSVEGNVRFIYAILASDATGMIDDLARYAEFLLWNASRKDKPK